jgi:hypothetical protein
VQAQERLLRDVFRLGDAAHHPVRDGEHQWPELVVAGGDIGHSPIQPRPVTGSGATSS